MVANARKQPLVREFDIEESERRDAPPADDLVPMTLSSDEMHKLVAEAAYYRAEQRGFAPGSEVEDWLTAEAQILAGLGRKQNAES